MNIDWNQFTPMPALLGGALIGLAASWLILVSGRIAGISGVVNGLLNPLRGDAAWRAAFIGGLLAAPWLYRLAAPLPPIRIDTGYPALMLAGLLVGIGTGYGSGCTSGHGVCGIARLSPRSLAATLCFMATAMATACLVGWLVGG